MSLISPVVTTPFGEFVIKQNVGFLSLREDLKEHMTIPEVEEHYRVIEKLTEGKKIPIVIDVAISKPFIMEMKARKIVFSNYDKNASCYAFVSANIATTFFINLFFKIAPTKIPMRIFDHLSTAQTWIQQLDNGESVEAQKMA